MKLALALGLFLSVNAFAYDLTWEEEASVLSPPLFTTDYEHSMNFSPELYQRIVGARGAEAFAADVSAVNGGAVSEKKVADGSISGRDDFFYVTRDQNGAITSVFVEVEGEGTLPAYADQNGRSDDVLCFFAGPHAGTCGLGDDT
jgi:hypothetical protein